MSSCKNPNIFVKEGFSMMFQIVFTFAFLTIFFFAYVVTVEKGEFEDQINYVVDQLLVSDKYTIFKDLKGVSKDHIAGVIAGAIDEIEFRYKKGSKKGVDEVNESNNKTRGKAFKILSIVVVVMIVMVILLLSLGYCLNIQHNVSESLWVILFVGITELAFLQIVAKNYISADPNNVKRVIGSAIEKWINENKK